MRISRTITLAAMAALFTGNLIPATPALADLSPCLNAAHANDSAKSYRAVFVTTRGTSTIDIVKPDRYHATMAHGMEMTAIGSKAWMKEGGSWRSVPGFPVGDMLSSSNLKFKGTGISCVDAGMGLWHGTPAHIYKGTALASGSPVTATLYVFPDGFVHHIDSDGSHGHSSFDFSNFNSVSISAPS